MNVFLVTECINNSGLGHLTRCLSLYHAFEEKNITPKMIINSDVVPREVLGRVNILQFNWLKNKNRLYKILERADVVVMDSYLAGGDFYRTISRLAKVPVYFDDNKRLFYPSGIVINGALNAEELNYPAKDDIRYLLGRQFIPLRKEFWDVPKKKINEKIKTILVTFGGSDERNLTPKVLKYLSEYDPDLFKMIIVGSGFKNVKEIQKATDPKTRLVHHPNGHALKKAMLESDLAISAAGQTLYELLRIGVPPITVQVIENQANNIKGLTKAGAIAYAGSWEEEQTNQNIRSLMKKLEDIRIREKMGAIGKKLIDANGSRNIVKEILSMKWHEDSVSDQ